MSIRTKYKQNFENPESEDQSIFATAYVPLKLCLLNDEAQIIWENPRPSSTLFCRPVNFQFIKESREVIQDAWQSVENKISLLTLTKIDTKTSVKHKILTTMFDGKICSTIAVFWSCNVMSHLWCKTSWNKQPRYIGLKKSQTYRTSILVCPICMYGLKWWNVFYIFRII